MADKTGTDKNAVARSGSVNGGNGADAASVPAGMGAKAAEAPPVAAAPAAGQHRAAMLRHDPAAIRRLFETGEYPYATHLRTGVYETHMLELQRELLRRSAGWKPPASAS